MSKDIKINPANEFDPIKEIINQIKIEEKSKVTKSVEAKPQQVNEIANKWEMNQKIMDLFSDKFEKDTKLREKYARILIIILIVQLVILNIWFMLKGFEILKFSDTTFNIFITGGLAEVFVLIRVIVKYLFDDKLTDLLKLIIRETNMSKNEKNKRRERNKIK